MNYTLIMVILNYLVMSQIIQIQIKEEYAIILMFVSFDQLSLVLWLKSIKIITLTSVLASKKNCVANIRLLN